VTPNYKLHCADTLDHSRTLADNSVDLVLGSPPYEARRTYNIGFNLRGEEWVAWARERFLEHYRISRGAVVWVCEGETKGFSYSGVPLLLFADLLRAGVNMRHPCAYHRVGVAGSGGPDYFRNDFEFCIVATKPGRLPWSDNTACGKPPKYKPGGRMKNRDANGDRCDREYKPPTIANPGNFIVDPEQSDVLHGSVGGGHIGDKSAHDGEAPFPEWLADRFVRSFCPPGGTVYDPFSGTGTTGKVALISGRSYVGTDVRAESLDASRGRLDDALRAYTAGQMGITL